MAHTRISKNKTLHAVFCPHLHMHHSTASGGCCNQLGPRGIPPMTEAAYSLEHSLYSLGYRSSGNVTLMVDPTT